LAQGRLAQGLCSSVFRETKRRKSMACMLRRWILVTFLHAACDAATTNAQEETCAGSHVTQQLLQGRNILHAENHEEETVAADFVLSDDGQQDFEKSVQSILGRTASCPWQLGCHKGKRWDCTCEDGTNATRCRDGGHGERVLCGCSRPYMCAESCLGNDYCCSPSEVGCSDYGGLRQCPTPEPTPLPTTAPPTLMTAFFHAPSSVATTSNWGSAMRELMGFCQDKGYKTGVPTGHSANDNGKEVRGIWCLKGEGVNWFDAPSSSVWKMTGEKHSETSTTNAKVV